MAAVVLGMDPRRQLAWFEPIGDLPPAQGSVGRLCARHARTMVLPHGWFLDDRRVDVPTLFASPAPVPVPDAEPVRPKRRTSAKRARGGQSTLGDAEPAATNAQPELIAIDAQEEIPESAEHATDDRWTPHFDQSDDLDGLLRATTPLLARAFGRQRRR